jgi:uncharacterized membrane protein
VRPGRGRIFLSGRATIERINMSEPSSTGSTGKSFGRTALAALVFLVAAWLLLGVIVHIVSFLFSILVLVLAVVAVVWALRIIL